MDRSNHPSPLVNKGGGELRPVAAPQSPVPNPTADHWKKLVSGAAEGSQDALAALYDQSLHLVYPLSLRILRNPSDAEEVTLDVYAEVWKRAPTYDPSRGSVAAWLVTLTRSRAIDRLRARAARSHLEEPVTGHVTIDSADDPEEATVIGQRRRLVKTAVETLPPEQRKAIELAFFDGLSHAEVAAQLGAPLGTVKTRIRLGMVKLREVVAVLA